MELLLIFTLLRCHHNNQFAVGVGQRGCLPIKDAAVSGKDSLYQSALFILIVT